MNDNNKNHLLYPFFLTLIVTVFFIGLRGISFERLGLKNVDILSDLKVVEKEIPYDEIFSSDEEEASEEALRDSLLKDSVVVVKPKIVYDTVNSNGEKIIPFEDYSVSEDCFSGLAARVASPLTTPLRIAFLGDSFIEGDLLTMDVRENLQRALGGRGVGFVPVYSAVANFRSTVAHSFSGWETVSMKSGGKAIPSRVQTVVGSVSKPKAENAWVEYKITEHKKHLKGVRKAYFYCIATSGASVVVTVNGTLTRTHKLAASKSIQRIVVDEGEEIGKVRFAVTGLPSDFYAYGVSLESDEGVVLDSFGDRGSSGAHFAHLDSLTNLQFAEYINYDLIVVEFGLNVLEKEVMKYTAFENRMTDAVNRLKMIYPNAAIVIMGVGDRVYNENGNYVPMPSAAAMRRHQRNVAKRCGIAYWDTCSAMGGPGSMVSFVKKGYAAKDYIHLSWRGAAIVADKFTESLFSRLRPYRIAEPLPELSVVPDSASTTMPTDSVKHKIDSAHTMGVDTTDIYSVVDSILSDTTGVSMGIDSVQH